MSSDDELEWHLLELVAPIKMAWSDGEIQATERLTIDNFLSRHLQALNPTLQSPIELERARAFVETLLDQEPSPAEWRRLTDRLLNKLRDSYETADCHSKIGQLLGLCVDVANSATMRGPAESRQRFDADERRCLQDLENLLNSAN